MSGGRRNLVNREDTSGDNAALSLIGQEVAMEVAAAAEILTIKRMASKQAAIDSLAAASAKEQVGVSDQSMLTAQSLLPNQREELYSSGEYVLPYHDYYHHYSYCYYCF